MSRRRGCAGALIALAALIVLCGLTGLVSAVSNRNLPIEPPSVERLAEVDKARLAEALQLRRVLGDNMWPGFGDTDNPVLLWNRETSFLVGTEEAPSGWQPVSQDTFFGVRYFRLPTENPQNFAVPVGGRLAASIATKSETDRFLVQQFHSMLPPLLNQVFPYRLLIQPSEVQISAVLHESFHVMQSDMAADKLAAAEEINRLEDVYWRADETMADEWKSEVELLIDALKAGTRDETAALARQFIEQRRTRRSDHSLPDNLVDFERLIEWEEGLAKYVELASWRQASQTPDYTPVAGLAADPAFHGYTTFDQRWSQELATMRRQATQEGVTRFYYTGAAQAFLLDRLAPGWQTQAMAPGVYLEDLLADAVRTQPAQ